MKKTILFALLGGYDQAATRRHFCEADGYYNKTDLEDTNAFRLVVCVVKTPMQGSSSIFKESTSKAK